MSTSSTRPGGVAWTCVDVLERFGVGPGAVADAWDLDLREGTSLRRAIAVAIGGGNVDVDPPRFLRETLAASPRCVDTPARYWDSALQVELAAAFGDVGASVEIVDATGLPLDEGGAATEPFHVSITDAEGVTHSIEFTYPETPMGRDNFGAAIHAVDDRLLEGTGFRFVSVAGPEDRWRFVLLSGRDLRDLREEYGERVSPFGEGVLDDTDPSAYVPGDDLTVPSWAATEDGDDGIDLPETTFEPTNDPSPDAILGEADPDDVATGDVSVDDLTTEGVASATAATDGGVVEGDFESFVADLGGTTVPRDPDAGPDPIESETPGGTTANGGGGAVTVAPDETVDPTDGDPEEGLDAAFAEIERAAVTEAADPVTATDASEEHQDAAAAIAEALRTERVSNDAFGTPGDGWGDAAGESAESADGEFEWVRDDDLASR